MSYPESPWSYTDFSFLAAIALGMGAIICVVSLAKEFVLVALALLVVVCFLLGSIPWGVIISKSVFHTDIREHGSGNIGTTNAMRTMGKKGGVAVFVLDFGKGLLSGLIALFVLATFIPGAGVAADSPVSASTVVALAFLCCTLGHIFSPWLKFKGGKGIAVAVGCLFVTFGVMGALLEIAVFAVVVAISRFVSAGSLAAAIVWHITSSSRHSTRLHGCCAWSPHSLSFGPIAATSIASQRGPSAASETRQRSSA